MSYSNYDVAHRWAYGVGNGCSGSHMFFEGNCIYSYGHHFMIARKYKDVVLFNEATYSVSTSKHQSYVRNACWQKVVYCACLTGENPESPYFFDRNMDEWYDQIKDIVTGPLAKARKPWIHIRKISDIVSRAETFCDVLGKELPKKIAEFKEEFSRDEVVKKMQDFEKKEKQAAERRRKKKEAEAIKNFMEFKSYSCNTRYQILRYNRDKNRFETSFNVEIPFEKGREFYEKLKAGTLKVGDMLLHYKVLSVGRIVQVGCHTFEKSYLLKYGEEVFS